MSSKILLVYEEYSEMMSAQAILQKVGFDVLGISTEYTLSENVLSFNPDIVVAFGRTGKVTTIGVGRRLREMTRWQGKVILVLPAGYKPNPQDFAKIRADLLLEAPLPALRLMQVIGKMLGIDELILQERLGKHGNETVKGPDGIGIATGGTDSAEDENLIVVGGTLGREDARFLTGSAEGQESIDVSGTLDVDDEESFIRAKAKFNLDVSTEAEKPVKKEDQDLEALWKELTNHSELNITPEDEAAAKAANKKINFDLSERGQEVSEQERELLKTDLQNAQKTAAERVSKYGKYTAQINDFDPRQSLSKMASRKVQQDIAKTWNNKEIGGLDDLRRNFTKALFRKK